MRKEMEHEHDQENQRVVQHQGVAWKRQTGRRDPGGKGAVQPFSAACRSFRDLSL